MITITNIQNMRQFKQLVNHIGTDKPISKTIVFPIEAKFSKHVGPDKVVTYREYVKENRLTLIADV